MLHNPYFIGFELLEAVILVLLAVHAFRSGPEAVSRLGAGVLYGLLLELLTIRQTNAYHYGPFSLIIFQVPLVIGIAWANQLYASRLISDCTSLPQWGRAILDALLVIYLDLLVEPVATRLGFWHFGTPPDYQWFGTPYPNFWGFFWIVTSFSLGSRFLARSSSPMVRALSSLGAIVVGAATLFCANAVMVFAIAEPDRTMATALLMFAALGSLLVLHLRLTRAPPAVAWQFVCASLAFFFGIGLLSGVLLRPTRLLVVSAIVTALGFAAYIRWGVDAPSTQEESGSS